MKKHPLAQPAQRPAFAVLGACLALSATPQAGFTQTPPDPLQLDPQPAESSTSYLDASIPMPAWASPDTPYTPTWALPYQQPSPFLRPGLGTAIIGAPSFLLPDPHPTPSPIRSGPFDLWPRLAYEVTYGNGVNSGANGNETTWLQSINPGITLGIGDHWSVIYAPSIRLYTLDDYENTVNQAVALNGQTVYQNWHFRFNHATAITSDPLVETGVQTDQSTHSTSLGATWDHGTKGVFDFALSQNIRLTDRFSDVVSWNAQTWYDYPWKPSVRVGVGLGFGYDLMDDGADMFSERLNLRLSGPLTRKFFYSLSGGFDVRNYYGSNADPTLSPLVTASVTYQVLDLTAISASFSHDIGSSYYADQLTKNTSFQATLTQILGRDWSLSGSGGYRFTSYEFTTGDSDVAREDASAFAGAAVNWRPLPRFSTSLFYGFRANDSDTSTYTFDSHQVGLRFNWAL